MPDRTPENISIDADAITDADTGATIFTREHAERVRAEWTAQHPPIPGLRWHVLFSIDGQVRDRYLEVIPGWEDAYAPAVARAADSNRRAPDDVRPADETDRLGALAYHGWLAALPDIVRERGATWDSLPEPFREPLRQAAALVWQHAENSGFHQALLRTLPAGQLGAAGALEELGDFLAAVAKLQFGVPTLPLPDVLAEIHTRVTALRRESQAAVRDLKDQN